MSHEVYMHGLPWVTMGSSISKLELDRLQQNADPELLMNQSVCKGSLIQLKNF